MKLCKVFIIDTDTGKINEKLKENNNDLIKQQA